MSRNSQEVVREGWLTKSPPTKRIWRAVSMIAVIKFALDVIQSPAVSSDVLNFVCSDGGEGGSPLDTPESSRVSFS